MMDSSKPGLSKDSAWPGRKVFYAVGMVLLALMVGAEFFAHMHPHFDIDALPAFYAWFSLLACLGLVLLAKGLALLLTRKDTYYDDDHA